MGAGQLGKVAGGSMMARLQLWEIHEQPWCPAQVREGTTDCLNAFAIWAGQYAAIVPILREAFRQTHTSRVIDLCSGSGGPWLQLYRRLNRDAAQPLEIVLTDLYPNLSAMRDAEKRSQGQIRFIATPVDTTQLSSELDGFRTLFTAFHHFRPEIARSILQDAVNQKQGIAIFEQTSRSVVALLVMLAVPWLALLIVPFIRPFRLSRLFWTYIIPAIPMLLYIDGIISCLRTYSKVEMQCLIAQLHGPAYVWEIGHLPSPLSPIGVHYTIGYPAHQAGDTEPVVTTPRVERMK